MGLTLTFVKWTASGLMGILEEGIGGNAVGRPSSHKDNVHTQKWDSQSRCLSREGDLKREERTSEESWNPLSRKVRSVLKGGNTSPSRKKRGLSFVRGKKVMVNSKTSRGERLKDQAGGTSVEEGEVKKRGKTRINPGQEKKSVKDQRGRWESNVRGEYLLK